MDIDRDLVTPEALAMRLRLAGHPLRLRILEHIARRPGRCVCDLAAELRAGQPAVSHHLAALRNAGLVVPRREGARVEYEIDVRAATATLRALGAALGASRSRKETRS